MDVQYYTYILKSTKDGKYYYGHSKDLTKRLKEHNAGKVRSTKGRRPFVILYSETFTSKSEAYKREMYFKSIEGYNYLRENRII
ncbi:GIY-YIG nuclease family protein [Litoribacter ruber]|uniref:GIY-YIG nuclease family protein n=1 Tax=Litoribacter ruber TaxID=702568 RepID=UPI001BDB08D6|nr:GIY-YIG nuclease family protein [Litoribacter ruber]MBT0811566.1 GIY-YIG nuclease family protein [Litoribacter ruber]